MLEACRNPDFILFRTIPELFGFHKVVDCLQHFLQLKLALPDHVQMHSFVLGFMTKAHLEYFQSLSILVFNHFDVPNFALYLIIFLPPQTRLIIPQSLIIVLIKIGEVPKLLFDQRIVGELRRISICIASLANHFFGHKVVPHLDQL